MWAALESIYVLKGCTLLNKYGTRLLWITVAFIGPIQSPGSWPWSLHITRKVKLGGQHTLIFCSFIIAGLRVCRWQPEDQRYLIFNFNFIYIAIKSEAPCVPIYFLLNMETLWPSLIIQISSGQELRSYFINWIHFCIINSYNYWTRPVCQQNFIQACSRNDIVSIHSYLKHAPHHQLSPFLKCAKKTKSLNCNKCKLI